jgi:hypothetical protein
MVVVIKVIKMLCGFGRCRRRIVPVDKELFILTQLLDDVWCSSVLVVKWTWLCMHGHDVIEESKIILNVSNETTRAFRIQMIEA